MKTVARSNHTRLSCYVDDVILSGLEEEAIESSRLALIEAARQSGFVLNDTKSQRPSAEITAFNVVLSNGNLAITERRMHEFEGDIISSEPSSVAAIIAYVHSINRGHADELVEVALTASAEAVRDVAARFR